MFTLASAYHKIVPICLPGNPTYKRLHAYNWACDGPVFPTEPDGKLVYDITPVDPTRGYFYGDTCRAAAVAYDAYRAFLHDFSLFRKLVVHAMLAGLCPYTDDGAFLALFIRLRDTLPTVLTALHAARGCFVASCVAPERGSRQDFEDTYNDAIRQDNESRIERARFDREERMQRERDMGRDRPGSNGGDDEMMRHGDEMMRHGDEMSRDDQALDQPNPHVSPLSGSHVVDDTSAPPMVTDEVVQPHAATSTPTTVLSSLAAVPPAMEQPAMEQPTVDSIPTGLETRRTGLAVAEAVGALVLAFLGLAIVCVITRCSRHRGWVSPTEMAKVLDAEYEDEMSAQQEAEVAALFALAESMHAADAGGEEDGRVFRTSER